MDGWIDAHAPTLAAAGALAAVAALAVLSVLAWRLLVQGRRALLGAQPVMRAPRILPGPSGGLVLEVVLENMAAWPAHELRLGATVEGRPLDGGVDGTSVFGVSADGSSAHGLRTTFTWPVGVLDAAVEVRWWWRDGAGRHRASWSGHLRTPAPPMPAGRPVPPARTVAG